MNGPRHLWSGDWEDESSARAAELTAQRGRVVPEDDAPEPETPQQTPQKQSGPTVKERLVAFRRRHARQFRLALVVGALVLVGAGAAYAVSNTGSNNSHHQVAGNGPQNAWLGIEMVSSPSGGVMVARVEPKSPAQKAGIKPGDVIT